MPIPNISSIIALTTMIANMTMAFAAVTDRSMLSDKLEMIKITEVGAGTDNPFQSVTFSNTYTDPIVVCTYEIPGLPTTADPMASPRLNNVTSTGFEVTVKPYLTSDTATPSNVFCTIAESGTHTFDDGGDTKTFVAGKVESTQAETQRAVNVAPYIAGILGDDITGQTASALASGSTPALFAQVMTYNNPGYQAAWTNNCSTKADDPIANSAGNACIGKHISNLALSTVPEPETIGFIAIDSGTGITPTGVRYQIGKTTDTIQGVKEIANSTQHGYNLNNSYELGIGTLAGADGWHMGQAQLHNSSTLENNRIQFGIDDYDRSHTAEPVSFMTATAVDKVDLSITKTVSSLTPQLDEVVTFSLAVTNTGEDTAIDAVVNDVLPAGFTLVDGSMTGGDSQTNNNGNLEWNITSLPTGSTVVLTFEAVINSL
jgi:uncharacterized repeat protein (TIGR01451 family)